VRLATRSSALALAQAGQVAAMLGGGELVRVSRDGDGDKSRFVRGVEEALLEGAAEIGVHSAKDLPAEPSDGLEIAGVPPREDPRDAWVGPARSLDEVAEGTRVGTASLRRASQLRAARPDLRVTELHGNVDTRLRRLRDGEVDALVLALAGLRRLDREQEVGFVLDAEEMTPAAGQGALALQARAGDADAAAAAASISDPRAAASLAAERSVVAELGASCSTPVGVHAELAGEDLVIESYVGLPDGSEWIRDRLAGDAASPAAVGAELAARLLAAGGGEILERAAEAVP
jgi:hydroxymethylbilane synthase